MRKIIKTLSVFTVVSLFISESGCEQNTDRQPDVSNYLSPGREWNVAFVVEEGVYNSELIAPMDIFHHTKFHVDPAMKVFTVARDTTWLTTFEGLRIQPDYSFIDPDLPTIDVLVVPSAEHSMNEDLLDDSLIEFVSSAGEQARYILSLCDGAFVLAKAGLVDGHISTTFPGDINTYRQRFPDLTVVEEVSFVHDKKLITSAGGAKSYDAALYLCEILYGHEIALNIARGLVIDWDLSSIAHQIEE